MSDLIHGKRQGTDIDRGGGKGKDKHSNPISTSFTPCPQLMLRGGFDMNFTGGADVTIPTVAVDGSQRIGLFIGMLKVTRVLFSTPTSPEISFHGVLLQSALVMSCHWPSQPAAKLC